MKRTLNLFLVILLGTLLSSCEIFPDTPEGTALVYLPAATSKPYLVPGVVKNYRAISDTKMLHVPVYVSRSGLSGPASFSVNIAADNDAAQQLIDDGAVDVATTIIAPAELYTMPASATIGAESSSFDAIFDANKMEPYIGKKLLLAVAITDPSKFEVNADLSTLFVLVDVNLVLVGAKTDVTNTYLKNSGAPFIASSRSSSDPRRGVLANWTTSSSVKNFENGAYGGFDDYGGGGFMSMERYGSPEIPNGKIYQTVKLPAARYDLEVQFLDFAIQEQAYFAAASGNTLPDVSAIETAISYTPFPNTRLQFEVLTEQDVSLGVVANLIQNFQYFRINKFKLYQYKNIFE